MEELRVPTRHVAVEIAFTNGSIDRGSFYLTESPYPRSAVEDLADFLNDERDYVPFSSSERHVGHSLIRKRHLRGVRTPDADEEWMSSLSVQQASAEPACVLLFDDDSRLVGRPVHEVPESCSRLVDKFNHAPSFLPFLTPTGLEFVQVAHVVRILMEA